MIENKEIQLLSEFQKYDYLNKDKRNPYIKILVSYIKPSFLFKSEILTPIHLGRSIAKEDSKDGVISEEDLNWLQENCIGDNDFVENISSYNRRVGFLTGTYWAWKNYEKLGNPEYFASFGYRRLLPPVFLKNINEYDFIIPKLCKVNAASNKSCLIQAHGKDLYVKTVHILKNKYGEKTAKEFEKYLSDDKGYYFELYVMKKELFFDFCEWIFPILFELLEIADTIQINEKEKKDIIKYFESISQEKDCNNENFEKYQLRSIGFMMERLTGFYEYMLVNSNKHHFIELETVVCEDKLKSIFAKLRKKI